GSDPTLTQRKAGPWTIYLGGIPERIAAVRRTADVQPHGLAAARRLAVGLVGRNGVLKVDVAGRLCLCAFPDGHAKSPARRRGTSCGADRRALYAAIIDCRLGRASGVSHSLLAARPVYGFDRPALLRARREQSAPADVVRPHRSSRGPRPLFSLRRIQHRQLSRTSL